MSRTLQPGTGALIATLLAVLLSFSFIAPVQATEATTTDDPAEAAAGWLADQMVDGERFEMVFGEDVYPDHGLTADAVFALAAAGVASDNITAAADWLTDEAEAYLGFTWGSISAGATAKLTLVMLTDDRDPRAVSDLDLIELLLDREVEDQGSDQGRFVDDGDADYSSTLTQSLAVLALHRATDVSPSEAAVDFLVAQQCDDGGFRFAPDVDGCSSDADTTAYVIQALEPLDGFDDQVAQAAGWLAELQNEDGGVDTGFGPNANTTGLAAAALEVGGEIDAAAAARDFLVGLQDGCDDEGSGAIRFDSQDGGNRDRSTAQAIPGLVGASLASVTSTGASNAVPTLDCEPEAEPEEPTDPEGPEDPEEPEEPTDPEPAPVSSTATLTCDLDDLNVVAGDEVACAVTGLHPGEDVRVTVTVNPTLLDDGYTADEDGTVDFTVTIPDDRAADEVVAITVTNGEGDVLASLSLTVAEVLPETGTELRIALVGLVSLLSGVVLVLGTRQRGILA